MALSKPMFYKTADIALTIGVNPVTHVQCQVHSVAVTPDVPDLERYVTLCGTGGNVSQGRPTWTVDLTIAQAWGAADLARLLWDNAGQEATLTVQAHGEGIAPSATQPAVRTTVLLVPGPYGGEAETWLEQEVSLPCTSDPVLITTGPLEAEAEAEEPESAAA